MEKQVDRREDLTGTSVDRGDLRAISDVLKDISVDLRRVIRSELELAKIEAADAVGRGRSAAILLAGGGLLAVFALGFFLLTAMFALEILLAQWLAALIVAVLLLIASCIGLARGRRWLKAMWPPRDTVQAVKEDLQWMREKRG